MRFILDENVPRSASAIFTDHGFRVAYIRDLIPAGSVDQLVAFVAEDQSAVLVSNDGDFQKIALRIPDGQKTRFRNLSRIWLRCTEYQAAQRIEKAFSFIEAEFVIAAQSIDRRMILSIGNTYIRSER
jgi:predicted nuclease of predicted toxin-antitoxin system